ncbi:hypothetical protein SH584_11375 [Sphingomonas sp. LY29]|nr:hypothetical protein [Sphingomonas sp. LY29]WRP25632.1 hypothetical protein SH584_11375 [Sphingomonas sp. LY29]
MGATSFWTGLISTPDAKLVKADLAKLAARHEIPVEWAAFYLKTWLERSK